MADYTLRSPFSLEKLRYQASTGTIVSQSIEQFGEVTDSAAKRAWGRLVTQVYEVDLLVCTCCGGPMRIIASIEQAELIEKLLTHLGLCAALSWSKGRHPRITHPSAPSLRRDRCRLGH